MIDLDHFKIINDQFGHDKGDKVLTLSAKHLINLRRSTDWVYRWGGEEFICILPDTHSEAITSITDILHEQFKKADWQALGIPSQTISIGVACTRDNVNKDFETLFKEADAALYTAKKNGRNQTVIACT